VSSGLSDPHRQLRARPPFDNISSSSRKVAPETGGKCGVVSLGNPNLSGALSRRHTPSEELNMSDPRLERDPDRRSTPYANRQSTAGPSSVWIAAIVAVLVVLGLVAYSYRGSITASNDPATTSGQTNRAPAPTTSPTPAPTTPATTPPN
jgi:hypothetical protein